MPSFSAPIVLDGAHGEGSGALLRTALQMAALTQQPVKLVNIRAATQKPGLNSEDLTFIRALARACQAETVDAEFGAHSLTFTPTRRIRSINESVRIAEGDGEPGNAGALVVAHGLIPCLARSGAYSAFTVTGETYGHNILSFDYFSAVTLPALRRMGLYATAQMVSAGYGWGARGEVDVEVEPSVLSGVDWSTRGDVRESRGIVAYSGVQPSVGARGVSHLENLARNYGLSLEAHAVETPSRTPGAYVTVWAECENGLGGATCMGAKGMRIEAVAQRAFEGFRAWLESGMSVDPYLADQLLVPACLAEEDVVFRTQTVTLRLQTMAWVIKQFLPIRLSIRGEIGKPGLITVRK